MTVAIFDTEPTYKGVTEKWLLLHENPVSEQEMSGKSSLELHYMFELSEQTEGSIDGGETPLHVATRRGDFETMIRLSSSRTNVNTCDKRGWTPLHRAASAGMSQLVSILSGNGATVDAFDNEGRSPLVLATEGGHLDTMVKILEAGADVNASDPRAWSPICTAVMTAQLETLSLLLAFGADPSSRDARGFTPLIFAIAASDRVKSIGKLLDALLEAGADPNVTHRSGVTALEAAARGSDTYAAERLIAHGASPTDVLPSGYTPLCLAIEEQSEKCVKVLLSTEPTPGFTFLMGKHPYCALRERAIST